MSIDSIESLLETLGAVMALDAVQMEELERDLAPQASDPRLLGRELVRRGWITPFQINQLFQGRGRDLLVGPYLLQERLGVGRIGTTYKARHRDTGRVLALKILNKEIVADPAAAARLREAIRDLAQIHDPHLAVLSETEQLGDVLAWPMELVEGTDLGRAVQKSGPIPLALAVEYACQVAAGLAALHDRHVFHGSVIAANIVPAAKDGAVKLLSGDLSHLVLPSASPTGPDRSADLRSLGRVLHYLLTGSNPEKDEAESGPNVPAEVSLIIGRLLGNAPHLDFADVREVVTALTPFRAHSVPVGEAAAAHAAPVLHIEAADSEPPSQPEAVGAGEKAVSGQEPAATEAPSDSATSALADSVTSQSTFAVAPGTAAPPPGWKTRLLETARKRPWQVAAGAAIFLLILGLLVVLLVSAGSPAGEPDDHDRTRRGQRLPKSGTLSAPELLAVLGGAEGRHGGPVRCAAWDPKGKLVATGGDDNMIRLWDPETLADKGGLRGHKMTVTCLAFSPDGRSLLSGGDDGALLLWNVETRKRIAPLIGPDSGIRSLAFAADGRRAVSGSLNGQINFWDVESREKINSWSGDNTSVNGLAFSDDGKTVLSGDAGGKARLWNVDKGTTLTRFEGHSDAVTSVAFVPGEKAVVAASADKTSIVWDLKGQKIATCQGHMDAVNGLAFEKNKTLWSAGADGTMRRWNVKDGQEIGSPLRGHDGPVFAIVASPDGTRMLTVGRDHTVRLWDTVLARELHPRVGHTMAVQCVGLSSDGKLALTGGADNTVRLWDIEKNRQIRVLKGSQSGVSVVAFSPDDQKAAAICGDSVAKIWGVDKGEVQGRFSWKILTPALNIAFSPDGSRIVTSDQQAPSYRIVLRDVSKGDEIRTLATHFQPPQTVAVSPDGKRALSGSDDWKVLLSDLETGKELLRLAGPTGAILNVIFTPDGRSALAICADRTIWQWNLKTGRDQQLADLREPAKFTPVAAALAPDGAAAAYCGADGALVLWDVKRGKELQRAPLSVAATRVVFSADSRLLATANANGTASVYRVGSAGE